MYTQIHSKIRSLFEGRKLNVVKIYGQVNRNIQALESTQMVGGYTTHGAAVTVPPKDYTYSDTGMFQDSDGMFLIAQKSQRNVNPD